MRASSSGSGRFSEIRSKESSMFARFSRSLGAEDSLPGASPSSLKPVSQSLKLPRASELSGKAWGSLEDGSVNEDQPPLQPVSSSSFLAVALASSASFAARRGSAMIDRTSTRGAMLAQRLTSSRGSLVGGPFYVKPQRSSISVRGQKIDLRPPSKLALCCNSFLQAPPVQVVMTALTILVLYCGDMFASVTLVSWDAVPAGLLLVCMIVFLAEWIVNIISSDCQTPRYRWSLFFYLDFVAMLSIGLDILLIEAEDLTEDGPAARAARAARVGTRAGRSMRLMRLLRFIRLVRVTRMVKALLSTRDHLRSRGRQDPDEEEDDGDLPQTTRADSIGVQIGARTTKKVVIMTLCLLTVLPFLESDDSASLCNQELLESLKSYVGSLSVGRNCTLLQKETAQLFGPGTSLQGLSRQPDQGLTINGIICAVLDGCLLFGDPTLMGSPPMLSRLLERRRGPELQVIPCEASMPSIMDGGEKDYLLYDMRAERVDDANFSMGFTSVVIVILLGAAILLTSDAETLAGQLISPISALLTDMQHTSKLELDLVSDINDWHRSDIYEIQKLQGAFHNLFCAVSSFSKFTPLEVVRHFLSLGAEAKLGVEERNVSIFFSDIAGFTTICEGTAPRDVLALLSEYFEQMVSIICEEGGTMLEFIGDAILAIWNAPSVVPDHAVRAVTSAIRMNEALEDMRRDWGEQGKPDIRIRVGVHSADVYVGNLGSRMRMKYGVLGDGVNLASRLEELNKRYVTTIMISEDVLLQPGVRHAFAIRQLDLVVVKGRSRPTAVYEVMDAIVTASDLTIQVQTEAEKAFKAYRNREFDEALRRLLALRQLKGGVDRAGDVLLERCRRFLAEPPPPGWDGSEVLTQKTF